MSTSLTYAIRFVANMSDAVRFHVDELGLTLRFQSPEWTEFNTGPTTLALHIASEKNPAGTCQLGFGVADLAQFHATAVAHGIEFTSPPTNVHG